jgi:hypothetical protein
METRIKFVDEPGRLILAWQAAELTGDRYRWAVGEVAREPDGAMFRYYRGEEFRRLNDDRDEAAARRARFLGYPAFDLRTDVFRDGVIEAFLRRLPPRSRADFTRYLKHFWLRSADTLGAFVLLAVTEAKLPSDGFSLVDPLDAGALRRDLVFEIAGHRRHPAGRDEQVVGQEVRLVAEPDNPHTRHTVRIDANGVTIGYANRPQAPTLRHWLETRSVRARLLRLCGTEERPRAFVFVGVREREDRQAA